MSEDPEQQNVEGGEGAEPVAPKNILKAEQIVPGLSHIAKTHDGASYAFTNLVLEEKELEELGESLRPFQHLRFLSLSKNQLKDVSEILHLPFLLTFQAAENQIASIDFLGAARDQSLHYLQHLILTKNKLTALPSIPLPRLTRLLLNENEIATCAAFDGHPAILHLDLSKNKLQNMAGLSNMPQL
jgi:Leucine-rich repeat (LRR) protein